MVDYADWLDDYCRNAVCRGRASPISFRGFLRDEVDQIELFIGRSLPSIYREFLLKMGRSAGILFGDVDMSFEGPWELLRLRQDAEQHWSALGYNSILSENSFVFSSYGGTLFSFFDCSSETENPVSFDYEPGYIDPPVSIGPFTEVLNSFLRDPR